MKRLVEGRLVEQLVEASLRFLGFRAGSGIQSFSCLQPLLLPPAGESSPIFWAPVTGLSPPA